MPANHITLLNNINKTVSMLILNQAADFCLKNMDTLSALIPLALSVYSLDGDDNKTTPLR